MRYLRFAALLAMLVLVSACLAPEDLDYTPTAPVAPTADPNAAAVAPTEAASAVSAEAQARLEALLAALPQQIPAGAIQWNKIAGDPLIVERDGGITGKVEFDERGGGASSVTFGVFDNPDQAQAFYDKARGDLRTLEQAEERDQFPTPNAFGGGTYGSDAIFVIENTYIRISVPRFSSTAGDPLNPYTRALMGLLSEAGLVSVPE
jgi:hypothetical protein